MNRTSLHTASQSTSLRLLLLVAAIPCASPARAEKRAPAPREAKVPAAPPAPPSTTATETVPPDPCKAGVLITVEPLARAKPSPERQAIRDWDETYSQCPTPENLEGRASAYETVGRKERSVVHLEQALSLHEKYLQSGPSPARQAEVEKRMGEIRGLIASRRAGPFLEEARAASDAEESVAAYDRYLQAVPDSTERAQAQAERDRRLEEAESQWKRRERGRQAVGFILGLAGVGAAAGGAYLVSTSRSHAESAMQAATLGEHNEQLSTATIQQAGGVVLLGAGGALLIAGVVRLATGRHPEPRHALWVSPTSNGLLAGGTF